MPPERMTPTEARRHLARLRFGQQAFARMIRVNPSTVRRWLNVADPLDMPGAVEVLLRTLTPGQAMRLMKQAGETPSGD